MMSLIDLDDDQRWVPTHVNVTVLRARGLRTKGKHGSRYLYAIIQVGKEKYTTGLVEKAEVPEWNEECCFELLPGILEDGGRSAYPPGSGDLVLTVMHRVLIGLDVFLGQTIIPLDKIFQDGVCPRDEWFKLNSKAGRKEKERGELQVTVQFTRNNMTASMFDLTMKDKPRSAFGKLKDRVTGRKRADMESSSAIVPGRYAALSGSLGQPFGEEGRGPVEAPDVEIAEEKRSKMKDFFKGRLRKSSDTRSCSSLASESSISSMASDNTGPPPSLDLLSDPPSSPIYTSKVRVDTLYGETDLAKKVLTSQHTTKVLTHKRAFSDEASKISTSFPRTNLAVESLKGQTMTQSKSSLCINGSHIYDAEPSTPKSLTVHSSKLVLLEKCSPLSRSLQNLTKKSEDKGSFAEGRRWSFDKTKKEEREEEKEAQASSTPVQQAQIGGRPVETAVLVVSSAANSPEKGRKLRKTLFSGGRSDSLPAKSDLNQAGSTSEGRIRGWFGSADSQNKPRLEVSPKVESSSDVPPPLPPRSPVTPQSGHVSPDDCNHTNPFTPSPSPSPSSTPISPSKSFPSHMQRNPFFEELIAEEWQRSPPFGTCSSSSSSPFHYTTLPSQPCTPSPAHNVNATNMSSIKRERPRPVARQISLPALLPKSATPSSPNDSAPRSMSESTGEWDDSFDAFASSRLNSPKESLPQKQLRTSSITSHRHSYVPVNTNTHAELQTCEEEPPPLPPRKLMRTSVNEIYSDGWLHRGQELAVHKEAYLLSQTGVASLQRGREGECKRNSISPDPITSSETSDSLSANSQPYTNITSPGFISEEKLKKFKYEPLEDETDRWGGMFFEQDLYGRVCRGNYGQPNVNSHRLSLNAEETAENKIISMSSGPKVVLDSEMLNTLSTTPSKPDAKVLDITTTPVEETECNPLETTCINNNVSFSLTLGDLNMNVNNSDFTFIDSDGSSQSEVVDAPKGISSFGGIFPQPSENLQIAAYHAETKTTVQDMFPLKDTYIPEMNSSFEITASSNKLCKVSPVCPDNCQDCLRELNNVAPHGNCRREIAAFSSQNQTSNPPDLETESREDIPRSDHFKKAQNDFDNNGNPEAKTGTLNQKEAFPGVVSARFRPKGVSRQNSSGSPYNQSESGDGEFEQLMSLVQNISGVSEGPLSYQPTKSALSSLLALNKETDLQGDNGNKDQTHHNESNTTSQLSSKDNAVSLHTENCATGKSSVISFEDLHAKVAPNLRTPSKSKIGQSLQEPEPSSPSIPCALSLSADAPPTLHPTPVCYPSIHPSSVRPSAGDSTTLAVAPYTSFLSSSSYSTTSTTDQPLVDARHSLLPEETQPASNLPHLESRPHPVKPLTSSQSEKKEGRSVLEKLKSTIHPGRTAHQVAAEPERNQEVKVDISAQYQHLTNMELISLLLQQEMDMQKQQAASEQQEAQLQKCEAELKKVKLQVRDLEDYIDNLLLRIMEQTPTLLQVRTRHK
ncbi:rab11 family-interacting protein 1 isoform X1 [Micropterus dolomieu]|uniref:rab11 family-interacting protein 1 isoform X1 n=2 Tax=Micropterus dolomieu TaxID=147949 RepID=UPI001E8CCC2E|nr:rab11 family-interacting protein 1 isoform X1 [Micropterus dolomieu]